MTVNSTERSLLRMVFCGIDIGTTNAKGILLDRKGNILSRISIPNPSASDGVIWYDHFSAIMDAFHKEGTLTGDIFCSITSQGGSFVLLDEQFRPVGSMYSWTEAQTGQPCADNYLKECNQEDFYRLNGWQARGWQPIFKLKDIDNRSYSKVALVPDFIYAQIAGKLVTDMTNAQMTGFFDFRNKCWHDKLLAWAGIKQDRLPEICDSVRVIFPNVQTRWGRLNCVTSSHDQYAAMNAISLEVDKDIMLASGTAWVVNSRRSSAVYDDRTYVLHPGRDIAGDHYGNISVVGSQLGKGFHDLLCSLGVDYSQLERLEDELLSLPAPTTVFDTSDYDPKTQTPTLIKRYMEWMAATVKNHFVGHGFMQGLKEIILTGGAANSRVLPQVLADVCGIAVKTIVFPELTAYGAAKHAAQAAGVNFETPIEDIAMSRTFQPANRAAYQKWVDLQTEKF